jgi:hypothetical protein
MNDIFAGETALLPCSSYLCLLKNRYFIELAPEEPQLVVNDFHLLCLYSIRFSHVRGRITAHPEEPAEQSVEILSPNNLFN